VVVKLLLLKKRETKYAVPSLKFFEGHMVS